MTLADTLDATRLCARWSAPLADPAAWVVPAPAVRTARAVPAPAVPYSWRALARNPRAALVSAMVGVAMAGDAALRRPR